MDGKACIRDTRVTVSTIIGLLAEGHSYAVILENYPYLTKDDILQALSYCAWRMEEQEIQLST